MAEQTKQRMTADEFRQLPETLQPTELINGELIVSPTPVSNHQRITRRITRLLEDIGTPGEVMQSPMDVYVDEINALQPDVFWLADNSQCVERDGYFYGAPELVVEVLSPSTSLRDKRDKFWIYQANGVYEYWIADPIGKHIEVFQRQDETFHRINIFTDGDTFESLALGKRVHLNDIFDLTSPSHHETDSKED